jgi:hypothetical protein
MQSLMKKYGDYLKGRIFVNRAVLNKDNCLYVIRYGFDYEHDNILGVFTSYYYAGKAKTKFMRSNHYKQFEYHYVNIECYIANESNIAKEMIGE